MSSAVPIEFWIVLPVKNPGWAHDILKNLSWGISAAGHKSMFVFDHGTFEARKKVTEAIKKKHQAGEPLVVIDLFLRLNDVGLPSGHETRHFSIIGDSPIHHFNRLRKSSPSTVLGIPDRRYEEIYKVVGLKHRCVFMPYSGCDPIPNALPMGERDIDLLFTGTIGMTPYSPAWNKLVEGLPRLVKEAVNEALDVTLNEDTAAFMALINALEKRGVDWHTENGKTLFQAHKAVETYAETLRRIEILTAMEGLNLHFMGDVSYDVSKQICGFTKFHKFTDFENMLELVKRTKLLINICPKLAGGAHTRIWNGIAHGCVNATTRSSFLDEEFEDGVDLLNLPDDSLDLNGRLSELLRDNEKLDDMVCNAKKKYTAKHLWRHRAADIAREMIQPKSSVPPDLMF
ncbi:MAG: hypothetical protein CBB68_09590 [Rhodospirillaceae bacterium TMED8]|nr:hypothetical protein [Magnetovibrio sp.]OUT50112.1 MAG: hypothetical protein CBB68_09590 [Rhodospirillaceae bacterium TMED8]